MGGGREGVGGGGMCTLEIMKPRNHFSLCQGFSLGNSPGKLHGKLQLMKVGFDIPLTISKVLKHLPKRRQSRQFLKRYLQVHNSISQHWLHIRLDIGILEEEEEKNIVLAPNKLNLTLASAAHVLKLTQYKG